MTQLKDRRVRAGAESEREDRHGGERRIAHEQPEAVAQVLPDGLDEAKGIHFVYVLADLRHVPELAMGRKGRLPGGHAARDVVVDFMRQVVLQFLRALGIPVAATEEA